MPETVHSTIPEQAAARPEAQAAHVQPLLSHAALEGVGVAAQHYYGANDHSVGRDKDGWHNVVIAQQDGTGGTSEKVIGAGINVELALEDTLKQMRTLETVRTRSLAHIEMTETSSVDFTSFAHYSPKVAPSRNAYPVPGHLEPMLTDGKTGIETYSNTVNREGWQTEVRGLLNDYVAHDPAGQKLVESLKIRSLDHLTPEQAVKLSAAFVQNVSKYTVDSSGKPDGSRADGLTAPELLREGMARKGDPTWEGSGVCRNIASNVKAVFESLKQTQSELSMLNNTYAVYGASMDSASFDGKRDDLFTMDLSGHAWNTFVTVDSNGSAVATIIDATWALGKDADTAVDHLDRTEVRAAYQITELFKKSERKTEAFEGLTLYADQFIKGLAHNRQLSPAKRDNLRDYAVTEYLKAVQLVDRMPDDFTLPESIVRGASRLQGQLEQEEITALFNLDRAGGSFERGRIQHIIKGYDGRRKVNLPPWKQADNLVFQDPELQELAYEAIGPDRVAQLAETSGKFRMRLRQQHPDELPAFDPYARAVDAEELGHIASRSGIHDKDPKAIIRIMSQTIKKLAGDDAIAEAITVCRSEYDLAVNYQSITDALRKRQKS